MKKAAKPPNIPSLCHERGHGGMDVRISLQARAKKEETLRAREKKSKYWGRRVGRKSEAKNVRELIQTE